jgi:CheY-like chemotaxis protein
MSSELTILSQVSHEIKTPLTAILGYAEFIKNQADSLQDCRNAASIILNNSEYLLQILDDLLEAEMPDNLSANNNLPNRINDSGNTDNKLSVDIVEKLGGAKLAYKRRPADISQMIHGVYGIFANAAESKGLYFTVSCSTLIPRIIVTEIIRVRQILINLVGNAIKFTLSGGVRVILSWHKCDLSGASSVTGILRIDVCDSGIGISPEVLPRLFIPYQQADQTIKNRFGGTGLGLAISQKLANKLGGEIIVTNNTEGGSTFSFLLPVKLDGDVEFIFDLFNAAESGGGVGEVGDVGGGEVKVVDDIDVMCLCGCRILVVEDSVEVSRLLEFILRAVGAEVESVDSGEKVFEILRVVKFDVILMDVGLPLEDGYTVTRRLRDDGYKGQIIALTADNSIDSVKKSIQAGCNAFATKPFSRREIIKVVLSHYKKI